MRCFREENGIYTEHYTIKTFTTTSIHRWAKNRKILSVIYKSADGLTSFDFDTLKVSYQKKKVFCFFDFFTRKIEKLHNSRLLHTCLICSAKNRNLATLFLTLTKGSFFLGNFSSLCTVFCC